MFEKVNPSHPDKIADRIAGAIVDIAYKFERNPKVAAEVLIGHGKCYVIIESSVNFEVYEIASIVKRIAFIEPENVEVTIVPQDEYLAKNQSATIKCGDNGIFKGVPMTFEEKKLSSIVQLLYREHPHDGKYIYDQMTDTLIGCQSMISTEYLRSLLTTHAKNVKANPLGNWTGGIDVDSGATNRKLGSDMGDAVTGGGLMGKDLSKADVSVNIYCHLLAQDESCTYTALCAIGDDSVQVFKNGEFAYTIPYEVVVETAREYINKIGGFEKLAEWGLIRVDLNTYNE